MEVSNLLLPAIAALLGWFLGRSQRSSSSPEIIEPDFVGPLDAQLKNLMADVGVMHFETLQERAGVEAPDMESLRAGEAEKVAVNKLAAIANALDTDVAQIVKDFGSSDLWETQPTDDYYEECQRLRHQLDTQAQQVTERVRERALNALNPLLVQYPTLQKVAANKPDFPAANVLKLFASVENLLQDWQCEPIGEAWGQTQFDPDLHTPDADDIQPGETVYVRFVGYHSGDRVVARAKVSRTLPAAAGN